MKIPKQIQVGYDTYQIVRSDKVDAPSAVGRTHFLLREIELAKRDARGNKFAQEEVENAFWHELTHCILYDMNHPLSHNESFVNAFANRLTNTINSAKF